MYRIHVAAEKAGVSAQLLRAWERRYGLLAPDRTDSGYRLYSDDDVAVLRGAKALVDGGRSISEVARLPKEQLRRAGLGQPGGRPEPPNDLWQESALAAMARLDGTTLERLLLNVSAMGALPSVDICDRVLLPLLVAIGDRWEDGSLDVAAEHFGSAIIRRDLHALLETEGRRNAGAPAVVCACPEGDLHEGGLLGFAVHAAAAGWAIIYLGANTPVADMIAAADNSKALALAVSMTIAQSQASRRKMIDRLAGWKSGRSGRRVWIGGRAAAAKGKEWSSAGFELLADASLLHR